MVKLKVGVSDGASVFVIESYVGYLQFVSVLSELSAFRKQISGGICDIRFGAFGPEYGGGAFEMRLHFAERSRLYITCRLQGDYGEFSVSKVASQAVLYLRSQPVLLDNFIDELKELSENRRLDATLLGVLPWQRAETTSWS